MCFNWKVLAGLAVALVGVRVAAPDLFGAVLPLALIAACPLSMLVMMRGMKGGACASERGAQAANQPVGAEDRVAVLRTELAQSRSREQELSAELAQLSSEAAAPARLREAAGSVGP